MSTVLSTLQAGSLRELLSALASLATWKTLALILAVINLKNLPFIWHVSPDAGCTCTCPFRLAFEGSNFGPECCVTFLTDLLGTPAVPLLAQPQVEAECPFLAQGKGNRRCTGQAHTPSLRVMWYYVANSITGDRL